MRKVVIKIVTFAIFGILIASLAVWGIGDVFRASQPNAPVATVGDIEIGQREFSRSLTREVNRLSARLGSRFDIEQARALGVVDQVVGQLVGGALFDQKVAELGITVSDKMIRQRISEEPAFRDSAGQFDPNRFIQALQSANMGEQEFVEGLRRDILRQQLIGAITRSAPAPRVLAETLYSYREETRTARVLKVPNESILDLPEPDEPGLQAFHKEFSSKFMAPEYRAIVYVQLRAKDLASEIAVSEADVEQEFEARRDEFTVPERRDVDQIVFDDEAAATAAITSAKLTFNDAAADVPPPSHLSAYTKMGFDLVTFSGGKGLRAPQSTGLLVGRKDLIHAARLNGPPSGDVIGRGMKVNKEEMLAMMAAVEAYLKQDPAAQVRELQRRAQLVVDAVSKIPTVKTVIRVPPIANHVPHVHITWDQAKVKITGNEVRQKLREGKPSIEVTSSSDKGLVVNPWMLQPGEPEIVARRVGEVLQAAVV